MKIICLLSSSRRLRFYCSLLYSVDHPKVTFWTAYKEGCVRYGTYRGIPPIYTTGNIGIGHFGKFSTTSIPVRETSVSSVRRQYRNRTLRKVRYNINTCTGHFVKFGTIRIPVPPVPVQTFIPVRDTSVSSVHQYHFGKFGTTFIPVLGVPVSSVSSIIYPSRYWAYRYRTEHTLTICTKNASRTKCQ